MGPGKTLAVICVLALLTAGACNLLVPDYDVLDRFEVIKVVTDPQGNQHAVIVNYKHAETSRRVTAIWIETGEAPAVGSTEPRHGSPAAIWTGTPEALSVVWDNERLRVGVVPKSSKVSRDLQLCLADWLPESADLCVRPDATAIMIE